MRTLRLPDGGTIDIPLPGAPGQLAVRAGSPLADAAACPHLVPTILIPLVLGALIGVGVTVWVLRR